MQYSKRRQRLAEQVVQKYRLPKLMAAAAVVLRDRLGKEETTITKDEIIAFFESLNSKQIKLLSKIADEITKTSV
jgi:hypothetical protein